MSVETVAKACKHCFDVLPLADFYLDKSRKDGHTRLCKPCTNAVLRERAAAKQARIADAKARGITLTPLPAEAPTTFRGILEAKARKRWEEIADRMVDAACGGDKAALRLLVEQMIGRAPEQRDEDGPETFWARLLSSVPAPEWAGDGADVADAPAGLEPGGLSADGSPAPGPSGPEPPGGGV